LRQKRYYSGNGHLSECSAWLQLDDLRHKLELMLKSLDKEILDDDKLEADIDNSIELKQLKIYVSQKRRHLKHQIIIGLFHKRPF
jgi:hypothetical protein